MNTIDDVRADYERKYGCVKIAFLKDLMEIEKKHPYHVRHYIKMLTDDNYSSIIPTVILNEITNYSRQASVNPKEPDDIKIAYFLGMYLAKQAHTHPEHILKIMGLYMFSELPYPKLFPQDMMQKIKRLLERGDLSDIKVKMGDYGIYTAIKTEIKSQAILKEIHTACIFATDEASEADCDERKGIIEELIKEKFS